MTRINTGGPAYPFAATDLSNVQFQAGGMTKREVAAIAAMQGILAGGGALPTAYATRAAVEYADALIAALGEGQ